MVKGKCPRCHEGDVFPNNNPYNLKKMTDINDECSVCGQSFEPEPNFYYGAMYASYAYTVAIFVAAYITGTYILDWSTPATIGLLVGALVLLSPYVFRISRSTWLHINVKYNKHWAKK